MDVLLWDVPLGIDLHRNLADCHDDESLLHINHIDSGQTGQWITDRSSHQAGLILSPVRHWCNQHSSPTLFLTVEPQLA